MTATTLLYVGGMNAALATLLAAVALAVSWLRPGSAPHSPAFWVPSLAQFAICRSWDLSPLAP